MPNAHDIAGQTFGLLTAISRASVNHNGAVVWLCRCACGNEHSAIASNLVHGKAKSCKDCRGKTLRANRGQAGLTQLMASLRFRAKERELPFRLTREDVAVITQRACNYCGVEPSQVAIAHSRNTDEAKEHTAYTYNGIDRIDSDRGYELDNVVPCCKRCNVAKNDMPTEEFLMWVRRVYKHTSGDLVMAHILGVQVRCESVTEYTDYYVVRFNGGPPYVDGLEYELLKREVGISALLPKVGEFYTLTLGQ